MVDARPRVWCLGEVLFDRFADGSEVPGGAPANVAFHAAALGARAALISAVGRDAPGRSLRRWLEDAGVETTDVAESADTPTGSVEVAETGDGPAYRIGTPAAWDVIPPATGAPDGPGVAVFGTLAQRHPASRRSLRQTLDRARARGVVLIADLNLRAPFFDEDTVLWTLRHAGVLKLNEAELRVVSGLLGAAGERDGLFAGLLREFGIARGVLTLGGDGALAWEDGTLRHQPAEPAQVADTVGAGDAFCAVLALAAAAGRPMAAALPWCARAAGFVASRPGATPRLPDELIRGVRRGLGLEEAHGLD